MHQIESTLFSFVLQTHSQLLSNLVEPSKAGPVEIVEVGAFDSVRSE